MIFIGERINTGFKDIKAAVTDKNPAAIEKWARKQTDAGATFLDVNLGAVSSDPADMCWMIEIVQNAKTVPGIVNAKITQDFSPAFPIRKGLVMWIFFTRATTRLNRGQSCHPHV